MNSEPCEWLVLINPKSGENKGLRDWGTISSLLQDYNIQYHHRFTDYAMHGVSLVRELVKEGCRNVIVVGGDGFLNEIINGLFSKDSINPKEVTLGMIPVGTGNDWYRTFNIAPDYESAIRAIGKGNSCLHDVGKVYYQQHGQEFSSFFINVCGMGFDADVNRKVNNDRGKDHHGPLKYQYHLFTSLVSYTPTKVAITVDGKTESHDTFSMAVGIGRYNGGGMMQLPDAKVDDGLFDVTLIRKISRLKVIANVKHLYDGSFIKLPEVSTYRGKEIIVDSVPRIWLECDGEALGHTPIRFEIIPNSIKVISP